MNNLLIFFAIPVATIILSLIFETLLRNPFKVGGIAFSIFLVTAFALGGSAELIVAALVYTILAFIFAYLTKMFCMRCKMRSYYSNNMYGDINLSNNNLRNGDCLECMDNSFDRFCRR